ncbi:MAG: hypothetical protein AAF840_04340 [Bacteroidota bacterium]
MIKCSTYFLALMGFFVLSSCLADDETAALSRYESALAEGLASSATSNQLFLGLELAETDRAFYDKCTELNKRRLIEMGTGGNRVNHKIRKGTKRPSLLTFYPDFSTDRPRIVQAMDMEFAYDDWSPWNQEATAGKLLTDLAQDWLPRVFGEGFEIVPHPVHKWVLVQVKDNRRAAFWVLDKRLVRGRVTDLRVFPDEPLGLATE